MKVHGFAEIISLCFLFLSLSTINPVVAPTPSSSATGQSSSNHDNLRLLARTAVPSAGESGGTGSRSPSRSRSQQSSSISQGSHHSTAPSRHIGRGRSPSPNTVSQQQQIHHSTVGQSPRMSPGEKAKGKRPRSPSPQPNPVHGQTPRSQSPSSKSEVKLFGKTIKKETSPIPSSPSPPKRYSSDSPTLKLFGKTIKKETSPTPSPPSPKRQSSDSPTMRLFGKTISSPPKGEQSTKKSSTSLFGIDLQKEAAKGKQEMHHSPTRNVSPGQAHHSRSPSKSPQVHVESGSQSTKSEGSRHFRRSPTPESQKTDASFQYSTDSGLGAKSALSRRMPTQIKDQFSSKPQRGAESTR